ncbi:MAG: IclR family transcriptional regulator [Myxococcota bacterium]|jgi:DNA-binding IclR family transcriptional regulator|nr:IclR family transcriptional regulator [Myxococcota bacterium]
MTKSKSDYSIQTVSNALRVLEVFSDEDEIGVSDLSRRLGLHKNNVFRLLATLEENGYIEQSAKSERYRLGTGCLELGRAYSRSNPLLRTARPFLEALCEELGETVHIGTLRGFEVIHLDSEQPEQLVMTSSRVGQRLPAHNTALGKVMLGALDAAGRQQYVAEVLAASGAERRTENSISDPHKFLEHVSHVALHGSAVDMEECEVGLRCVAAPVHDGNGRAIAALSVSAPSFRFDKDYMLDTVEKAVVDAANRLSHSLGQ